MASLQSGKKIIIFFWLLCTIHVGLSNVFMHMVLNWVRASLSLTPVSVLLLQYEKAKFLFDINTCLF